MANGEIAELEPRWRFGGIVAPSPRSRLTGALTGRVVFLNSGHGWTFDGKKKRWFLQRQVTYDVMEDFGNADQLRHAADHCLNLGATVVPFRAIGRQPHLVEVNADSDSDTARATFEGDWRLGKSRFFYSGKLADPAFRVAAYNPLNGSARFTFRVPVAGLYPVYVWASRWDPDFPFERTEQSYVVHHSGGQTERRIDHRMIGCGWIYLGSFYFPANGIVEVRPPEVGDQGFAIADAVRIGNGTRTIGRGAPVPFDELGARYWIETALGMGFDLNAGRELEAIINEPNVSEEGEVRRSPAYMAQHMMRGGVPSDQLSQHHLYLSFHSDAGGGRGAHGLVNRNLTDGDGKPVDTGWFTRNQEAWAKIIGSVSNQDLVALTGDRQAKLHGFSYAWKDRHPPVSIFDGKGNIRKDEIREVGFKGRVDATIVETGFHDDPEDAALLADPKTRDALGRAAARAITDYFRTFDPQSGIPAEPAPERPWAPRLRITGAHEARLSWRAPRDDDRAGGGPPREYVVYLSRDGHGFGSAGTTTDLHYDLDAELEDGETIYARIAAVNEAGESMPSAVAGVRWRSDQDPILVVQAHEELAAENNPSQLVPMSGLDPVPTFIYRVDPARNNSFDYVRDVAEAHSLSLDSCWAVDVQAGAVDLTGYRGVVWCAGREGRRRPILSDSVRSRLEAYCRQGGRLLMHGARLATWLERQNTDDDVRFAEQVLGARLKRLIWGASRAVVAANGPLGGGLDRDLEMRFDVGLGSPYDLWNHDSLVVAESGKVAARFLDGRDEPAAIVVNHVAAGRVVYLAFPFEALAMSDDLQARRQLMAACLSWLGLI